MIKLNSIKKNLLDLEYNKYLQYLNTTLILVFTYFIGILVAILTENVKYTNPNQIFFVSTISVGVLSVLFVLIFNFKNKLKEIVKKIKKIKLE